jgi:hypothetical protein
MHSVGGKRFGKVVVEWRSGETERDEAEGFRAWLLRTRALRAWWSVCVSVRVSLDEQAELFLYFRGRRGVIGGVLFRHEGLRPSGRRGGLFLFLLQDEVPSILVVCQMCVWKWWD